MADLGWFGTIMSFHCAKSRKGAIKILTDALRSNKPIGSWEREQLAQLIEGKLAGKPIYDSSFQIKVVRKRSNKWAEQQRRKYEALDWMSDRIEKGQTVEGAAFDAVEKYPRLKIEAETLRKEYPGFKRAWQAAHEF